MYDFPQAETYLNIYGFCKECGVEFRAHCLYEPAPGTGIVLRVHTFDTSGIPHEKKRAIKGNTRKTIGQELLNKKPRQWRNDAVKDLSYDDPEPPYLPRQCTLRKIKEEAVIRELDINKTLDPVNSLTDLKYRGQYTGYIKEIGKDHFYCFYWSPMQMDLYKALIKTVRKIEIDATGKLLKSIVKINGDKKHIFLYQIVIKGTNNIQPVFQMITEKHDTNLITYWLREIIRHGAPIPPEVDSDYSMALLNATCLAFNERTLKNYVSDCYRWIRGENLQHPLRCYIRVDIAHLIKIICNKNVFDKKHPKIKDFFVRCVGVMSTCDNIEDFITLLTSIFIVAYSEYDGKDTDGNNVISAEKQSYLFDRIKSFTFTDDDNDKKYDYLDDFDESEDLTSFINNIREQAEQTAKQITETDRYNVFYCPEIVNSLVKLTKHFPIWTAIMTTYFLLSSNIATSCRCEAYFKELKHSDLGSNYEPMRADKFVIRHIKSIESLCKLEHAAIKRVNEKIALQQNELKLVKNKKVYSGELDEITDDDDYTFLLQAQENWKGLAFSARKKRCKQKVKTSTHNKVSRDFVSSNIVSQDLTSAIARENDIKDDTNKDNVCTNVKTQNSKVTDVKQSPLNKNNKERGKYLKPCPNVNLTYNRPLRKRKDEILKNGNNCNLILLNGERIYVKNTCAFDSLVEVLTTSYCNYSIFKNWIDNNSEHIFFSFITKYATEGVNNSINQERGAILCTIFDIRNNIVECTTNPNWLLTKLITDFCSVEENKMCNKCGVHLRKMFTIDFCATDITNLDFQQNFLTFISQFFNTQTVICKTCQSTAEITRKPNSYLFIDTELFFQLNEDKYPDGTLLSNIPETHTQLTFKLKHMFYVALYDIYLDTIQLFVEIQQVYGRNTTISAENYVELKIRIR